MYLNKLIKYWRLFFNLQCGVKKPKKKPKKQKTKSKKTTNKQKTPIYILTQSILPIAAIGIINSKLTRYDLVTSKEEVFRSIF